MLILFLFLTPVQCLNILLFVPTLSHSHVAFNSRIAEILTTKGHKVVVLLPLVDDKIILNSTQFEIINEPVGVPSGHLRNVLWSNPGPYEDASPLNWKILIKFLRISKIFVNACKEIANDRYLIDVLRNYQFDVGLIEQYDSCGFGLFKAIGIEATVWLSATGMYRPQSTEMGAELPLSYVPELFSHNNDSMSFLEKIENVLIALVTSFVHTYFAKNRQLNLFDNFYHNSKEFNDPSSVLVNSNPIFDFPMPTTHQFSNIFGFTVPKHTNFYLDPYWKKVADESTNGFILVSFGGIARTIDMPLKMFETIIESFSKFPNIRFILKYETNNQLIGEWLPKNIIVTSWIPQISLMAHRNYRGIFTHGGWSTILETMTYGKPMILMPLFADHAKNAKVAESKGTAIILDKLNFSSKSIQDSLHQLLFNVSYLKNCQKFSSMLSDLPIDFETIIDWRIKQSVKQSRKSFAKHLKPKCSSMSYIFIMLIALFLFIRKCK